MALLDLIDQWDAAATYVLPDVVTAETVTRMDLHLNDVLARTRADLLEAAGDDETLRRRLVRSGGNRRWWAVWRAAEGTVAMHRYVADKMWGTP